MRDVIFDFFRKKTHHFFLKTVDFYIIPCYYIHIMCIGILFLCARLVRRQRSCMANDSADVVFGVSDRFLRINHFTYGGIKNEKENYAVPAGSTHAGCGKPASFGG